MNTHALAPDFQEKLTELYSKHLWDFNVDTALATRLSAPLLLHVPKFWSQSPLRILYVGQETLGWHHQEIKNLCDFRQAGHASIDKLYERYQWFNFANNGESAANYRSPFWRFFRELRRISGNELNGQNSTVLWTNLFHFSYDQQSVIKNAGNALTKIQSYNRGLLSAEIQIIRPTHVIFVTGPNYDPELRQEFPGVSYVGLNANPQVSLLSHAQLPKYTLRSYHPAYSQRTGGKANRTVLEQLTDWLKE